MTQQGHALYDLQVALLQSWPYFVSLGVSILGFGIVVQASAPVFAARLRRLGLQVIGGVLFVYIGHAVGVAVFGSSIPPSILYGVYGIVGLMLLQGVLNLLFGPVVGASVISKLLGGLILVMLVSWLIGFGGLPGVLP